MQIEPKTILITGCSSGIGLCCAQGMKLRGWRVFATARNEHDISRLNEIGLEGVKLDLGDSTSINNAVQEIMSRTNNRLDALFNNAGYGQPGAVEDLSRDVLRESFETNVFGTHELTRSVLPYMRRQGHGRIVVNGSVLGFISLRYRGAYVAAKHALEGLFDTLRLELADTKISVSLIEPGPIKSRFRANSYAMFQKNIDKDNSPFRDRYIGLENRLKKAGPAAPFTLPPEAVLTKLLHALESDHPKSRYRVNVPTHFFAVMKRILPHRLMLSLLTAVSNGENR